MSDELPRVRQFGVTHAQDQFQLATAEQHRKVVEADRQRRIGELRAEIAMLEAGAEPSVHQALDTAHHAMRDAREAAARLVGENEAAARRARP